MTNEEIAPLDLDAIRKRCEAATPGPLTTQPAETIAEWDIMTADGFYIAQTFDMQGVDDRNETLANSEFIAHAFTDIPALLAEIDRLRAKDEAAAEARDKAFDEAIEPLKALAPVYIKIEPDGRISITVLTRVYGQGDVHDVEHKVEAPTFRDGIAALTTAAASTPSKPTKTGSDNETVQQ